MNPAFLEPETVELPPKSQTFIQSSKIDKAMIGKKLPKKNVCDNDDNIFISNNFANFQASQIASTSKQIPISIFMSNQTKLNST